MEAINTHSIDFIWAGAAGGSHKVPPDMFSRYTVCQFYTVTPLLL